MSRNTSVILGEHFDRFVGSQVEAGRYGSASEVMRAALRLLEEHEASLAALRAEIDKGLQSGISDQSAEEVWNAAEAEFEHRNGAV